MVKNADSPAVLCVANDRYVKALAVTLRSMAMNAHGISPMRVWVMDGGIKKRNRWLVELSLEGMGIDLQWVIPPVQLLEGVPVFGHVGLATYYWLLALNVLPQDIERLICLDVDIVVTGNINELWLKDFEGKALLGAEMPGKTIGSMGRLAECSSLYIDCNAPCLSAGVLVLDCVRWRNERIAERILEFIKENKELICWHDMDGLNAILWNDWCRIDDSWNVLVEAWKKEDSDVLWEDKERDSSSVKLVHFMGSIKPWDYDGIHPSRNLFFRYLDKTAWSGWRPRKPFWRIFWRNAGRTWLNRHFYGMWIRRIPILGRLWALARKNV